MSSGDEVLILLLSLTIAIVLIIARLRLFSIARTLKASLLERRGGVPQPKTVRPEVIERMRRECTLPATSKC